MATTDPDLNENGLPVRMPSGAVFKVLTRSEVDYLDERVAKYTHEFAWTNPSDLQDVDRMLILELMVYRWGLFLSMSKDYFGDPIDEQALRRSLNDYSGELRQLKKSIGLDKVSRDKERGDDSVPAYLERLRQRAKEFGINRNKMMDKGLELSQQLIALYTLYENCDEQERHEQQCGAEDILSWIRDVYIPEFQSVDEAFRKNHQTYWIADQ